MTRKYEPEFGSHTWFSKSLGKDIEFCNACGEYITSEGTCSNPMCPEPISDVDPIMEAAIDDYIDEQKLKEKIRLNKDKEQLPNFVIK